MWLLPLIACSRAAPLPIVIAIDSNAPPELTEAVQQRRPAGAPPGWPVRVGALPDGRWLLHDGYTEDLWLGGRSGLSSLGRGQPVAVGGRAWVVQTEAGLTQVDPGADRLQPLGLPGVRYAALTLADDGLHGVVLTAPADGLHAVGVVIGPQISRPLGPEVALGAWRLVDDAHIGAGDQVLLQGAFDPTVPSDPVPVPIGVLDLRQGQVRSLGTGSATWDLSLNQPRPRATVVWAGTSAVGPCVNQVDPDRLQLRTIGCEAGPGADRGER